MGVQTLQASHDIRIRNSDVAVERRADGSVLVTPVEDIAVYPPRLTDRLEHWAAVAPDRVFLAERAAGGGWRTLTYAEARVAARRLGQALIDRGLSAERPLLILSGNSIGHAMLALAAHYVGVPYCPVSPAYSLVSQDFGKLKFAIALLTPGLVFAEGEAYARALAAAVPPGIEVATDLAALAAAPTAAVDRAHAAVGPDTIAKFLLTSGSTGQPKAVINTQRMLCSNQTMIRNVFAFMQDEPPTIVDWLPWNHTFGGNHNVGLVLFNGGSLYIDDGRPTPQGIAATIDNLREVAPSVYFNVPKGYESIIPHLRDDAVLRERFYSRLQMTFYAAAGLAGHIWTALDELAVATVGRKVPMMTGLGATETAPFALSVSPETSRSGRVGLPVPGVQLKLVPVNGKLEARVRGPNVTPGYWRQPELTAAAFDDEGFYRFGDALRPADPRDVRQGYVFDGRLSEDFKLSTGTWVSVGPLRAAVIAACAPYVRDVVIAGHDRDRVTAILLPDLDACGALCGEAPLAAMMAHAELRRVVRDRLTTLAASATGSSNRVARAMLLDEHPSIDAGEVTDKGSINQRAVLEHRAGLVGELYADVPSARTLSIVEEG
ncbi:MAG: feruloyl-CoA synthase [Rhodospirillaceae bacterium]